jgi:hypothetical protein
MSDSDPSVVSADAPSIRRWYDQDPLLAEVLELLRAYPMDVRSQAEFFLKRIEEQVGPEALERFYALSKPSQTGNRWYDKDPVVSCAIELLRVVPPAIQRQAAERFLAAMQKQGLKPELLKPDFAQKDLPAGGPPLR